MGRREDDGGGTESFLPTYVYDANKWFEHMQVSLPLVSSSFRSPVVSSSLPFLSFGVGDDVDP